MKGKAGRIICNYDFFCARLQFCRVSTSHGRVCTLDSHNRSCQDLQSCTGSSVLVKFLAYRDMAMYVKCYLSVGIGRETPYELRLMKLK